MMKKILRSPITTVVLFGLAAVLLVTHENEAAQFADRVFTMDGGRLD